MLIEAVSWSCGTEGWFLAGRLAQAWLESSYLGWQEYGQMVGCLPLHC
jgi:hypothetical protein